MDALIDFYTRTDLITEAIAAEYALRADGSGRTIAEINTLNTQITSTNVAIDRYLNAFENNTLDERTCGQRVRDLTIKRDQLTTRRDELADLVHEQPAQPSSVNIARLRDDLSQIIAHGTPGQRKALIETHVAEIIIHGDTLTPTFMIPVDYEDEPHATHSNRAPAADPDGPPFRAMGQVVHRVHGRPNR